MSDFYIDNFKKLLPLRNSEGSPSDIDFIAVH